MGQLLLLRLQPGSRDVGERRAHGEFTVSFPRPGQIVEPSLAAAPRAEDSSKPSLAAVPTFPAREVDGVLVQDAYLWLECTLDRIIDGLRSQHAGDRRGRRRFGGRGALRASDSDDADLIREQPLLAYLSPGRFASVSESFSLPRLQR